MDTLHRRLEREHSTLVCMTRLYCRAHHGEAHDGELCKDCADLMTYAHRRLAKCPFGEAKPTCAKCQIHCYKRAPREQVRAIMRYAGPRMTWRHPIRALRHVLDALRPAPHPMSLRKRGSRKPLA